MKMKIRTKLIWVNFFIILIIILSQFYTQSSFFQKYYDEFKEKQLSGAIEKYEEKLVLDERVDGFLNKTTKEGIYLYKLDENMKVIGENGRKKSALKLLSDDGEVILFESDMIPTYNDAIKKGDYVQIKVAENKIDGSRVIREISKIFQGEEGVIFKSIGTDFSADSYNEIIIRGTVQEFEGNMIVDSSEQVEFKFFIESIPDFYTEDNEKLSVVIGTRRLMVKKIKEGYIAGIISIERAEDILEILRGFSLIILVPNLILAGIIIVFYSHGITKTISKMKEFAKSIALGRYGTKVEINSGDELEELGEALNDISIKLDEYVVKTKEDYEDKIQREKKHKFMLMNISHDLKTPLTVIKGYLKAIKDGIYDKDEYIDYTIEGVDDISETLTEMLELSKLKSDKYELHFQTSDFTRLVYKVINNLLPVAKSKNQNINFHLLEDVFLNIDENEMKKALENIVMNAIKYSPEESRINVSLTENVDEYIFSVENENTHIPEEEIENIFEEFYRVDKARNRNNRGSGLGLVIVKAILENHKRKFCIKNTEKGVKFNIYFEK